MEYELEKKLEGRPKKEKSTSGKLPQSDGVTGETAERLAKEHNMSPRTVERSANLFRSHQAVSSVSIDALEDVLDPGGLLIGDEVDFAAHLYLLLKGEGDHLRSPPPAHWPAVHPALSTPAGLP